MTRKRSINSSRLGLDGGEESCSAKYLIGSEYTVAEPARRRTVYGFGFSGFSGIRRVGTAQPMVMRTSLPMGRQQTTTATIMYAGLLHDLDERERDSGGAREGGKTALPRQDSSVRPLSSSQFCCSPIYVANTP